MVTTTNGSLLVQAAKLVVTTQLGSIFMLARKLHVRIESAGAIMDRLEELGIVAGFGFGAFREVLVPTSDVEAAAAAAAAGRCYTPPLTQPPPEVRAVAETLVQSRMPLTIPPRQRAAMARTAVGCLVAAGWRPTRS